MREPVYLAGISMTRFGVFPERSVKELTREAVEGALSDAGAELHEIEAAFFSNTAQDVLEGQVVVAGQIALRSMGFERIPMMNVENACASGATAVHMAVSYVRSGMADIALAVGVEKMNFPDMTKVFGLFDGGYDVHDPEGLRRLLVELGGDQFDAGTGHRSAFMEVYASLARAHMRDFGTTQRQLALISAKNHRHSTLNPTAHFRREYTVDEVLAARAIGFPLTVPMCAPMTDGAAAAVICNAAGLRRIRASRVLKVMATVLGTGTDRPVNAWDRSLTRLAALRAYEEASVGPGDMSVAEVHDASAFGELLQSESLGFCEIGAGGTLVESGATTLGGRIPINPSGGLESKGHPIGATGIAQLFELALQLRGEAGPRQVANARFGIAENGGGMYGGEEAVAAITILGR
ncbi:Acetyl-CoA acetyltransferase [Paraburkholderia steynii]|uniref:Acetyl-CoA acetyltransferase n=1 Tax=Paraburkholderia steynii TaxID=1245441 RepID=A0A7Z7BG45_9BURK|nr:thiolase family protein [Paraburkholderia steynii]SDJ15789.1 Acetyl-CoA acetyltransferase [Paraburkholderia steynii]